MSSPSTDPVATTRTRGTVGERADSDELGYLNLFRVYHEVLTQAEDDALRLVEVEKVNYAETANVLGVSCGDVARLVFSARQKLYFGMGRTLEELSKDPAA